jgi:AraC-like DNA-binding protein
LQRISVITFENILNILHIQTKIPIDTMLEYVNLTSSDLKTNTQGIQSNKLSDIFRYCVKSTNNPTLALDIGKSVSYHSLGLLGYLLLNTQTLQQMIEKFAHYQQLIANYLKFCFTQDKDSFKFAIYINENPYIPVPNFHAEVHLSAIISILTQILGQKVQPSKTFFTQTHPHNLTPYNELFGNSILFNQEENAIFFDKKDLKIPVKNSNPTMLAYFENQANEILKDLNQTSYYSKVKTIILKNISHNNITIGFIAQELNLSIRTLQNYLNAENKNFTQALSAVRMQLAKHYLQTTNLDYSSIAFLLGYSEASSFFRAFKHYYKKTPFQYKKEFSK